MIGSLSQDRVDGSRRVGGGAFHAARGLRLLGAQAVVVTKAAGRELLEPLVGLGLPVHFHEAASTARFSISYDGEERRMRLDELGEPWTPEEAAGWVAEALGKATWVHVAPLARSDFPAATLAELAQGRRVVLDGQGLARVPRVGPLALDAAYDPEVLRHLTVLKLAEEEAWALLPDLGEESLARLGVPEVLVTFGGRGSLLYADGHLERLPARAVAADATGAGDAYCAAYAEGRLNGYTPVAAAHRAAELVETLLARGP